MSNVRRDRGGTPGRLHCRNHEPPFPGRLRPAGTTNCRSRPPPPAAAGVSRDRRGAASKALLPAAGYPANSFISSGCVFCVIHRSEPIRSTKAIGIIHCTVVRSAAVA